MSIFNRPKQAEPQPPKRATVTIRASETHPDRLVVTVARPEGSEDFWIDGPVNYEYLPFVGVRILSMEVVGR
ncbi:MAG: hypothetical protein ABIG68_02835 [Acidobacteriota bacterium]